MYIATLIFLYVNIYTYIYIRFIISVCIHTHTHTHIYGALQVILVVKNPPANAEDIRDRGSTLWVGKITWRRA